MDSGGCLHQHIHHHPSPHTDNGLQQLKQSRFFFCSLPMKPFDFQWMTPSHVQYCYAISLLVESKPLLHPNLYPSLPIVQCNCWQSQIDVHYFAIVWKYLNPLHSRIFCVKLKLVKRLQRIIFLNVVNVCFVSSISISSPHVEEDGKSH